MFGILHNYIFSLLIISGLQIIPPELRQKWQTRVKALNSKLGGTSEKPISSILLMLETPQQMVVICTSGNKNHTNLQGSDL